MSQMSVTREISMQTMDADRPPVAEEMLVLHFVASHRPRKGRLFPMIADIDNALLPSPCHQARSDCEKFGWLVRGKAAERVPTMCRMVSPLGREVLALPDNWANALGTLDLRIKEQEARKRQF